MLDVLNMANWEGRVARQSDAIVVIIAAEILGDPYSKKSPLLSIGRLAVSPNTSSYQVLGQPRIIQRYITRSNHPRIHAQ